jgi:hypothetical protein
VQIGTSILEEPVASILRVEERRNMYLKMEMVGSLETLVPIYQTTRHHILEDHDIHGHTVCQLHPCHCELN